MKKNNRVMKVASQFLTITHGRYREMCSLAVTGQLGGPQMSELNEHIGRCDSCRQFLESISCVSMQVMPVLAGSRLSPPEVAMPHDLRAQLLSRLAVEEAGAQDGRASEPAPVLVSKRVADPTNLQPDGNEQSQDDETRHALNLLSLLWRPAAALTVCAVIGIGGFYLGHRTSTERTQLQTQLDSSRVPTPSEVAAGDGSDRLTVLEQERKELESRWQDTKEELKASETQEKALSEKLTDASNKLVVLTAASQNERQRLTQEEQQANGQVILLQGEVGKLRGQLDDARTKLALQQNESEELRAKLEQTESGLQRELDLKSAKAQMGDLVAARNLHIVDVYDADPNGKRQHSFGRVFYIEGKSLVFYAYDLEDRGRFHANVVFHVWGGKAGIKEVTHSLGILRKDDAGQSRWAMTFDDPKVLAQINSVFVTAEPANKPYDEPHGKKVLYAYFGTPPNHP